MSDPLQELAEKLKADACEGCKQHAPLEFREGKPTEHLWNGGTVRTPCKFPHQILPILTASVGTLLQAERAATIKECRAIAETNASTPGELIHCQGNVQTFCAGMSEAMQRIYKAIGKLDPDASALSAVVQRETAEMRETLLQLAVICHYERCLPENPFDLCKDPWCMRARSVAK